MIRSPTEVTLCAPPPGAPNAPAHASRMTVEEAVSDACEAVGRYVELRPRATLALTALLLSLIHI